MSPTWQPARQDLLAWIERLAGQSKGGWLAQLAASRDPATGSPYFNPGELPDLGLNLLLAAHLPLASALTATWFSLAAEPAVADRLHQELVQVLADGQPQAEDLPQMDFTRRVIAECLRLHPPCGLVARQALNSCRIGGYRVPGGSTLLISPMVLQHDPRFFPHPERFDPERWLATGCTSRPRWAFLPFGAGAQVCLSEHFTWMALILALATLARRWQVRLLTNRPVKAQVWRSLRPASRLEVMVQPHPF